MINGTNIEDYNDQPARRVHVFECGQIIMEKVEQDRPGMLNVIMTSFLVYTVGTPTSFDD